MTIRDAVIACVRMGMDFDVIAKAYKMPVSDVESLAAIHDIVRARTGSADKSIKQSSSLRLRVRR